MNYNVSETFFTSFYTIINTILFAPIIKRNILQCFSMYWFLLFRLKNGNQSFRFFFLQFFTPLYISAPILYVFIIFVFNSSLHSLHILVIFYLFYALFIEISIYSLLFCRLLFPKQFNIFSDKRREEFLVHILRYHSSTAISVNVLPIQHWFYSIATLFAFFQFKEIVLMRFKCD